MVDLRKFDRNDHGESGPQELLIQLYLKNWNLQCSKFKSATWSTVTSCGGYSAESYRGRTALTPKDGVQIAGKATNVRSERHECSNEEGSGYQVKAPLRVLKELY